MISSPNSPGAPWPRCIDPCQSTSVPGTRYSPLERVTGQNLSPKFSVVPTALSEFREGDSTSFCPTMEFFCSFPSVWVYGGSNGGGGGHDGWLGCVGVGGGTSGGGQWWFVGFPRHILLFPCTIGVKSDSLGVSFL
ncbi:hypothetical protein Ancab_032988 [Ancistrocladus abbreviatus]